jgi:thioredoxin reductase (NADPH)
MTFNLTNMTSTSSNGSDTEHVRVLILGSGPAGLSAALYTARADLEPVVLTGMQLGGQVSLTHIVENYPGFPEGIGGPEMIDLFQQQAERFGARIEFDTATAVDLSQQPFKISTYSKTYLADSLVIATGATPRHLEIPGEEELTGRGVSYCATCDGWFFKDRNVIVVGGGDSALEEGLFLTRYANNIKIIHRRDELRAGAILRDRAQTNEKMNFIWDTVVTDIQGDGKVEKVKLLNKKTGEASELDTDGVFIFIGHTPNTELFQGQLELDDQGYIKSDAFMKTSIPGVFVAGEASDPHFRQVITSAGMGAAAAMQVTRYLEEQTTEEPV